MQVKQAVVTRIKQICEEKGIAYNDLAVKSGITPSTLYTLMKEDRKNIGIVTIKKICDGLNMPLAEFFDNNLFNSLEQEIK